MLPLVLEHGNVTSPATVCSLLPVSKALKQSLACCQPCLEVDILVRLETLAKVAGFACWLRTYGHLVRELSLRAHNDEKGVCKAVRTMISLAASHGVLLGLQRFSASHHLCIPAMLPILSAHSITSLSLGLTSTELAAPALPTVFQQYSNLQKLSLSADMTVEDMVFGGQDVGFFRLPAAFLPNALSGLTSLQHVQLGSNLSTWPSLQGLPPSVQTLQLTSSGPECLLDVSHLTALTQLNVQSASGIVEGSKLPPSLLAATFHSTPMPADVCSLLSDVQQLKLITECDRSGMESLLRLSALGPLQTLHLEYSSPDSAAAAAALWGLLPQLRALQVDGAFQKTSEEQWQVILQGMAKAKSLISVDIVFSTECKQPCGVHIGQLQNLQALVLEHASPSREDMLELKKLTQLTSLELRDCSINDATAIELLGSLTGLQSLVLDQRFGQLASDEGIVTDAIVPFIKYQLKGLRHLGLYVPGVNGGSVGLLEGLTQLSKLGVRAGQFGVGELGPSLDRLRQVLQCEVTLGK